MSVEEGRLSVIGGARGRFALSLSTSLMLKATLFPEIINKKVIRDVLLRLSLFFARKRDGGNCLQLVIKPARMSDDKVQFYVY